MRTLLIASAGMALIAGGDAGAQRMVARGPGVTPHMGVPHMGMSQGTPGRAPTIRPGQSRWGSNVNGHWWGGVNAPGGWNAYRRPYRGTVLPSYWINPRFYVSNWSGYGLSQPTNGYNWVRYYDDAVLVDGRGSVYDTANGIDWNRYDDGYYTDDSQVYASPADRGYANGGYADGAYANGAYANGAYANGAYANGAYGANYDGRTYATPRYERRSTSSGVGGAVAGAAVGGLAGNLIAGRGDKLGGTLIGAGIGAAAGYAVDRSANTRTVPVAPRGPAPGYPAGGYPAAGYGADYGTSYSSQGYQTDGYYQNGRAVPRAPKHAPPPPRDYDRYDSAPAVAYAPPPPRPAPPPPPPPPVPRGPNYVSADGGTSVTTTTTGGYAAGGYYYPAGSTTTVVVQQQPQVTTTTTEIYEDTVTYVRPKVKAKKVYRTKAHRRAAPKCYCP